ncbi:MAG: ribose 5-phosphate isomerase B [Proteobacteria bacterium]|nr:ribose 5-phosphate isomerase B [Pseudomonadota bacterium]
MNWVVGSDHGGFALKQHLVAMLRAAGDVVDDVGTDGEASVDYPSFGAEVGRRVAADPTGAVRGIVVCGSGIGISIAANKVPGVRCALVHDAYTAELCRQHNDANVIALGGRVVGVGVAEHAVMAYRKAEFEGGRHARRVAQLGGLDPK